MTSSARLTYRRSGLALLVTMLTLVLLVTVVSELVTTTSVDAIRTSRRANSLHHRLAVNSMVDLVAMQLESDEHLTTELDRLGSAAVEATLGDCAVCCTIVDDAAKLDVHAFGNDSRQRQLARKLEALGQRCDLPRAKVWLRPATDQSTPQRYRWFDQLFTDLPPAALFRLDAMAGSRRTGKTPPAWSDVLTLWGPGRIDVRRVRPEVLEVALADVDRGLARSLLSARDEAPANTDFLATALVELSGDVRQKAAGRLAFDLERFALTIETAIRGDRRQWYVVATIKDGEAKIHYRGQVRW